MRQISKPEAGEFAPYAAMYIDLLPDDGRVLEHLEENYEEVQMLISTIPAERLVERPAPRKWTIKEILGHIIDDERIYAYRALRFARGDQTELPGFEQDPYVAIANANERPLGQMFGEYLSVRTSTISMFLSFDEAALRRTGLADGTRMSVRAIAYHIAGHELHHLNGIRDNYL